MGGLGANRGSDDWQLWRTARPDGEQEGDQVRQRSPAKGHRTEHYATSAPWGSNRNSHKRIYIAFTHLLSLYPQARCDKVNVNEGS